MAGLEHDLILAVALIVIGSFGMFANRSKVSHQMRRVRAKVGTGRTQAWAKAVNKPVARLIMGVGASLALANAALATSIALPNCKDQASGSLVTLYTDFQNGQRLMVATDAQEDMTIVLADCSNGFALQVRDRKNWFDGDNGTGATIYDRPGQVRDYLEQAVRSPQTHSWNELRKTLARDGYLAQTGGFSPANCGCTLSW